MDRDVVATKLESLRRCVRRIEDRRPGTLEELKGDVDLQDILSVNLERAVQLCVDLAAHAVASLPASPAPTTMAESFELLARAGSISAGLADRMRRAVGFRNIAVHAYQRIDWAIVFSIVSEMLDDFRELARAMARLIDAR